MKSLIIALGMVLVYVVQADAQSYSRYSRSGYQSGRTTVDVRLNSDGGSYSTRAYSSRYGPTSGRIYPYRYRSVPARVYYYPEWEGTSFSTGDSSIMMGTEYLVPARPIVPARPYRYRYR
jgi:hypothetical protein